MDAARRAEILSAYEVRARVFDEVARRRGRLSVLVHEPARPVLREAVAIGDPRAPLSPRRLQVLSMIADGYTNAGIATELHIDAETVKSHVRRLLEALGARNRAHAVAIGFREELIVAAQPSGFS